MDVIQIIAEGKVVDNFWYDKLLEQMEMISNSSDHLKRNYDLTRMDFDNHMSFDMVVNNNDIVGWGGMYHRPSWNEGLYRVSNRVYINPKYRKSFYQFLNPTLIVPKQIERYSDKISIVFISREKIKAKYYFKKLQKNEYFKDWIMTSKMVHVVPKSEQKPAYQYICYKKFKEDAELQMKSITEDEWRLLED